MDSQDGCQDYSQLANSIMERVQEKLKDLGRIPRNSQHRQGRHSAACTLSRDADVLIGRELELGVVLGGLRRHR